MFVSRTSILHQIALLKTLVPFPCPQDFTFTTICILSNQLLITLRRLCASLMSAASPSSIPHVPLTRPSSSSLSLLLPHSNEHHFHPISHYGIIICISSVNSGGNIFLSLITRFITSGTSFSFSNLGCSPCISSLIDRDLVVEGHHQRLMIDSSTFCSLFLLLVLQYSPPPSCYPVYSRKQGADDRVTA